MIRQNQGKINIIFVFIDIAIIVVCIYLSLFVLDFFNIAGHKIASANFALYAFILAGFYLFCYHRFGFYKSHRASRFLQEWKQISMACFSAFIASQIATFLFFRDEIDYEIAICVAIINYLALTLYKYFVRMVLKYFRKKGHNLKYLVIVGKNKCTEGFIKKIEQQSGMGYKIAGIFGDNSIEDVPFLGEIGDMDDYMANTLIDEMIITVADNPELLKQIVDKCNYYGIKFTILLDIFSIFNDKMYIYEFDNMLSISTYNIPLEGILNYMTKRIFDIVVSVFGIILLSPLMITVAALIKATSKGKVVYKQVRMGLNRKEFVMYKFRSMKSEEAENSEYKMAEKDDERLTKIGAFIRRYSIDELPQLFNVLRGNMSLVGPRPELPYHVSHFKDEIPLYMVKHYVKPGISGWAQVNGLRGNTSIEERIKYDIYYIENWSFWFDVKIIFLTLFKGIFDENAY